MKRRIHMHGAYIGLLLLLTGGLLGGGIQEAYAGKSNPKTGEKCQGLDCVSPKKSGNSSVRIGTVQTIDCNELEENKIHSAVNWLKQNLSALDQQMGKNKLVEWPGNSRKKFKKKLGKKLKFVCISQKKKCGKLLGIVYPVVAQKRINLCTNSIRDYADGWAIPRGAAYAHVIAHEIAHLVRLNAHRNQCRDKYVKPRFSRTLGLAAEYAFRGMTYQASDFDSACPSSKAASMDIIENKLKSPKLQSKK